MNKIIEDAKPKFKVGDSVTCSFREKEAAIVKKVIDVFPERDKRYHNVIDFWLSTDGGLTGKPINMVQEIFFTKA